MPCPWTFSFCFKCTVHCKYVQFFIVSTFHCNLAVRFTLIASSSPTRSYSKKTVISFKIIQLYLEQQLNVNRTVRMQWKVDTIKNCTYLQCSMMPYGPQDMNCMFIITEVFKRNQKVLNSIFISLWKLKTGSDEI